MKAKNFTKETIKDIGVSARELNPFGIGDVIAVSQWVQEGKTKRIQIFEGNVIAKKENGASSTFTVRKVGKDGIAIERIYPVSSPIVDSIKVVMKAKVRRAKLYYLRDRVGKKAKVKEKIERSSSKKAAKATK